MDSAFVVYRSKSAPAKSKAVEIRAFLKRRGVFCRILSDKETGRAAPPKSGFLIALGGDGTYLQAVHFGKSHQLPVLGVNMGSLGFLTPHHEKKAFQVLEKALDGRLILREHFFLRAEIYPAPTAPKTKVFAPSKRGKAQASFQAVNDIVIERGAFSRLISLSIYIDGEYIYSVQSDGLIVSGPLGSTAYNLAAGGPILHPSVRSFVITPICSHSLTSRPIIVNDTGEIQLRVAEGEAFLAMDGEKKGVLNGTGLLTARKDKDKFFSLEEKTLRSFSLLREKLKFGKRN